MKNHMTLCAALTLCTAGAAHADTVVVTADRMLDVIAGRVVEHPQITITDGRITRCGTQGAPVAADVRAHRPCRE